MKLQMERMEEQKLPGFKGGKKEFYLRSFSDSRNKIMKGRLEPGASIGMHTHESNSEIIYILEGMGTMYLADGGREMLEAGDCHYCRMGTGHSLCNEGDRDLIFFAVVPEHL